MSNLNTIPVSLDEDLKVQQYTQKLAELRSSGVNRVLELKQQNNIVKKSKMIDDDTKAKTIADNNKLIEIAKEDAVQNKEKIDALAKEAVSYVNQVATQIEKRVKAEEAENIEIGRASCRERV